ncbi:MAG: NAD(P)H-hydrate epimerase [Planctomycetes bacterium]|nr:NAD(P)H-hydrate epimerase [Planctomycetota bacterium]
MIEGALPREGVRELDRRTIEEFGVPGIVLMENAGQGSARWLIERIESGGARAPIAVLAGTGNNGGDGFVIARHLANAGLAVEAAVVPARDRVRRGSDAETNLRIAERMGIEIRDGAEAALAACRRAGTIVDALFGTGLDRPLRDPYPSLFEAIGGLGCPIFAVDLPSGLDANTGEVLGACLTARWTATFGVAKPGLFTGDGPARAGEVRVIPISIPRRLIEEAVARGPKGPEQ